MAIGSEVRCLEHKYFYGHASMPDISVFSTSSYGLEVRATSTLFSGILPTNLAKWKYKAQLEGISCWTRSRQSHFISFKKTRPN